MRCRLHLRTVLLKNSIEMTLKTVLRKTTGTQPDFTGKVGPLNEFLEQNPEMFPEFFREMLYNPDYGVRLRAGNAIEKAARKNPALLLPFKQEILALVPGTRDPVIIWHVALLLGYLSLEEDDLALAVNKLFEWLDTVPHKFAKINCMQTLAVLSQQHTWLQPEVTELLEAALEHESPAIRARARILLKTLTRKKR